MEHTILRGIVRLPDATFKPNKINVRSSLLHLVKRSAADPDLDDSYPVFFLDMLTLGYHGSGELIRNLDFASVLEQIGSEYHGAARATVGSGADGAGWRWFTRSSLEIATDPTKRFDLKYWDPSLTSRLETLEKSGAKTIKEINKVKTKRGKSPNSALYVDEPDGHALVIKAGTNINKQGDIVSIDSDYIEKDVFDEMPSVHVEVGDILLSSTGDGTLGKCAVFREKRPAIFDGHVTLIRVDQTEIYPEYLCDYLRSGFGAAQIARLFTGSTGLIELPPEQVDRIRVPLPKLDVQKDLSKALRSAEAAYSLSIAEQRAEAIRLDRERRLKEEEARRASLLSMAANLRAASDIRVLVKTILESGKRTEVDPRHLAKWSEWALAVADRTDPLNCLRFSETGETYLEEPLLPDAGSI